MSLTFTLAQLNPCVGDFDGNAAKLAEIYTKARSKGADLLITPEMYLSGYSLWDLVLSKSFLAACTAKLEDIARWTKNGPAILIGAPRLNCDDTQYSDYTSPNLALKGRVYNSCFLLEEGKIKTYRDKIYLPTYGVFDELRTYTPGTLSSPMELKGHKLAVHICEDFWHEDIPQYFSNSGAELLLALNGSVYSPSIVKQRRQLAASRSLKHSLNVVYVNLVGGQDQLIFDGGSFIMGKEQKILAQLPWYSEETATFRLENTGNITSLDNTPLFAPVLSWEEASWQSAITGLRDYMSKQGFDSVLLGISGGIDSALTATLAVDALGANKVRGFMLPSPYSSQGSLEDAETLATNLGIVCEPIAIDPAMHAFDKILHSSFEGRKADTTEENIQARIRGTILMALSNKLGALLLTTGNKSENAVGYATLYGDMCGALNLIGDLYKTQVYRLAYWRNKSLPKNVLGPKGAVIPHSTLTKAPSAELREGQYDQDNLPDYETLDAILHGFIEDNKSPRDMELDFPPGLLAKVWSMLHKAEYKRRQAAPTIKLSECQLGTDRQFPIVNRYTP